MPHPSRLVGLVLSVCLASTGAAAEELEGTAEAAEPPAQDEEAAAPAEEAVVPRLLVLDLVDRGTGAELTGLASEAAGAEAQARAEGDVVTAAKMRADLDTSALAQLTGCDAEGCMSHIAGLLGAQRVLGGSLARVGDDVLITLILVDARDGARLGESQQRVRAHPDIVRYAARAQAAAALGEGPLGEDVPLLVESAPVGARVYVDGDAIGTTPVVALLAAGPHAVTLRLDGHEEQRLAVTLAEGAPVALRAELVSPTVRLWPIAAGLGGAAALSMGGALWAGLAAANTFDGSYAAFTPDEDVARSYLHVAPADSAQLAEKQQQVEQLSLLANVLWVGFATAAVGAVVVEAVDVALWSMAE